MDARTSLWDASLDIHHSDIRGQVPRVWSSRACGLYCLGAGEACMPLLQFTNVTGYPQSLLLGVPVMNRFSSDGEPTRVCTLEALQRRLFDKDIGDAFGPGTHAYDQQILHLYDWLGGVLENRVHSILDRLEEEDLGDFIPWLLDRPHLWAQVFYHPHVCKANPFTDDEWLEIHNDLWHHLNPLYELFHRELQQAYVEVRLDRLRWHVDQKWDLRESCVPFWEICTLSEVRDVLNRPFDMDVLDEELALLARDMPALSAKRREELDERLLSHMRSQTSHPMDRESLYLATTVYQCDDCDSELWYDDIYHHECLSDIHLKDEAEHPVGDYEDTVCSALSVAANWDCSPLRHHPFAARVVGVLEAAGFDPRTTELEDVADNETELQCSHCLRVMDPATALDHALNKHGRVRSSSLSWKRVDRR